MMDVVNPIEITPQAVATIHDDPRSGARLSDTLGDGPPRPIQEPLAQEIRATWSRNDVNGHVRVVGKLLIDREADEMKWITLVEQVGSEL